MTFNTNRFHTFRDKIRGGSVSSGGFSEYDDGGGEFASGIKINEWQAAWNVTNAIQVIINSNYIQLNQ